MHDPRDSNWQIVKRILRYLKHIIFGGLFLSKNSTLQLHGFTDADWAGDSDDRRSMGSYYVFLGSNLVSWSCKQQATVARNSTEAEYKSLPNTIAEIQWLQNLLSKLDFEHIMPPIIWCDNIGATYLSANPLFHACTKHIEIDFHFVRDQVIFGKLKVKFLSSKDQLADIMTKPLATALFKFLSHNLNVRELLLRLRGRVEEQVSHSIEEQVNQSKMETVDTKTIKIP